MHDSSFLTNSCQLTSKLDLISGTSFELADAVDNMLDGFDEECYGQGTWLLWGGNTGRYDWNSDTQDNGILKYMLYKCNLMKEGVVSKIEHNELGEKCCLSQLR